MNRILNKKVAEFNSDLLPAQHCVMIQAFKTWCGHQYGVGIICPPPLVEIGLMWLPKLGVDLSPRPHAHRRACTNLILNSVLFQVLIVCEQSCQAQDPNGNCQNMKRYKWLKVTSVNSTNYSNPTTPTSQKHNQNLDPPNVN